MKSSLFGIVGWSGSGKTTLLEALLPRLVARGLRVNVVKHSHHDVLLEPPHKDSARMRAAGAAEVLLASPHRFVIAHELRGHAEPALDELLARLAPADLTLVEGYRETDIPKLEVFRPAVGKPPLYPGDAGIVAIASDMPAPAGLDATRAWLDLNQPEQVLAWLLTATGSAD
ncbi:MAG: molybdopterin-guanine dinucleotide biosynthesis protein MobB [Burkholderiaceae bacterium]|nr:molybdopterin-guanine dinucleotide biosynthesis protein MobB [Burkholderiaceae bacterium]